MSLENGVSLKIEESVMKDDDNLCVTFMTQELVTDSVVVYTCPRHVQVTTTIKQVTLWLIHVLDPSLFTIWKRRRKVSFEQVKVHTNVIHPYFFYTVLCPVIISTKLILLPLGVLTPNGVSPRTETSLFFKFLLVCHFLLFK